MINGIDIMELNCEQYRELISVLFQESVLLPYTIAQNVTGQVDEEIDRERLWAVLRQCGLADKIETLPRKENSFIGKDFEEDGIQLSGGQIQKLFLARALYKRSCMLILDEPTAALDAMAESEMYEQYSTLVEGKTSVYISHRLSSTRFCDRILFLENGQIAESGSHQELMEQDGRYAEMFRVQSQYYTEEDNK
jgi:ABC-type multidrug transport system fused ATPase/permease subunit